MKYFSTYLVICALFGVVVLSLVIFGGYGILFSGLLLSVWVCGLSSEQPRDDANA